MTLFPASHLVNTHSFSQEIEGVHEGLCFTEVQLGRKVRLVKLEQRGSRLTLSSSSGVRLGTTSADGEHAAIDVSAGEELLRVEMTDNEFLADVALAASVVTPLNDFIDDFFDDAEGAAPPSDEVELSLAGLTASLNFDASSGRLLAKELSLGAEPATVSHEGEALLTIEAGDGAQSSVGLVVTTAESEPLRCEFDTGFELNLSYAMQAVEMKAVNLPAFTLDDELSIRLSGEEAAVVFYEDQWEDLNVVGDQVGQLLQVAGGDLSMQSSAFPAEDVSVSAGLCLHRDPLALGDHGFLSTQFVADCE